MSPTLAPTAAQALAPLASSDLLASSFDGLSSLPSPTPPVPAAVAAAEPATTTPAPSGGFDASSKLVNY